MIIYQLTEPENRVWAFDQSTANLGAGQGFCAGMVIVWIFLRARDRDFDTTMGDIGGLRFPTIDFEAEELRKVQAYQAACAEKPGKRGYRSVLNPEQYEVEKAILAGPDVDADHRSLASTVSRMARQSPTLTEGTGRSRTWFLLRMRPARTKAEGGSGHVVAIEAERQNGNKVFRLMDPSNGQFQFIGTGEFQNWLTNVFFRRSGYVELYPYLKIHKVTRLEPTGASAIATQLKAFFFGQ